jgi:hypothetical protein
MTKKVETQTVRITGPNVWLADRQIMPGETVTASAEITQKWIGEQRAVAVAAEKNDDTRTN